MAGIAALVFAAPIVFVVQNSGSSRVSFLFLHERHSVTVALLVVAAGGWVLALALVAARILYVRRGARLSRRLQSVGLRAGGHRRLARHPGNPSCDLVAGSVVVRADLGADEAVGEFCHRCGGGRVAVAAPGAQQHVHTAGDEVDHVVAHRARDDVFAAVLGEGVHEIRDVDSQALDHVVLVLDLQGEAE
jgi:uncharacterized integral membrane protein